MTCHVQLYRQCPLVSLPGQRELAEEYASMLCNNVDLCGHFAAFQSACEGSQPEKAGDDGNATGLVSAPIQASSSPVVFHIIGEVSRGVVPPETEVNGQEQSSDGTLAQ